jgi:hypothetical protein
MEASELFQDDRDEEMPIFECRVIVRGGAVGNNR